MKGPAPIEAIIRTPSNGPWRSFANPLAVLQTADPAQVRDYLRTVEQRSRREGLFAAGFVAYEAAGAFGLPVKSEPAGFRSRASGCSGRSRWKPSPGFPRKAGVGGSLAADDRPTTNTSAAIARIKERIDAGDTYQINYTFRLTAPFRGDPTR